MGTQFRESSILLPPTINLVGGVLMNQVGGGVFLGAHARVSVYVIMKFRPVKPALN